MLFRSTSRKMADDFFAHFAAVVAPEQAESPLPDAAAANGEAAQAAGVVVEPISAEREPAIAASTPAGGTPTGRLRPVVWVTGLTAVIALVLYYFTRNSGVR